MNIKAVNETNIKVGRINLGPQAIQPKGENQKVRLKVSRIKGATISNASILCRFEKDLYRIKKIIKIKRGSKKKYPNIPPEGENQIAKKLDRLTFKSRTVPKS
ncbi:MAG: hypothetical protein WAO29_00315 [Candidatus Nanopelagicales bacterium]